MAQLMFCPTERGLPNLRRGYRTPDPSPSPSVADVVGQGQLELRFVGEEEEDMPTPRHHRRPDHPASRLNVSRTPSPSPVRNLQSVTAHDKLGYEQEFSLEISEDCPTPRRRFTYEERKETPAVAASFPQGKVMAPQCVFIQPALVVMGGQAVCSPCDNTGDEMSAAQSDAVSQGSGEADTGLLSLGSAGHPYTCADACKYVRKKRGCKDGASCDRCHICVWNKTGARRHS